MNITLAQIADAVACDEHVNYDTRLLTQHPAWDSALVFIFVFIVSLFSYCLFMFIFL